MTQVEWSELEPSQSETLLAVLLYSKYPRATRIRPSQGDFGIDVLVPNESAPETFDVYQIKYFHASLTASQKGQIDKSFRRMLIGLIRRQVPVADWYLVMPLNPTVDNFLDWLAAMPDRIIADMFDDEKFAKLEKKQPPLTEAEKEKITTWRNAKGKRIEWKDRSFCVDLAAKYSYVVDYYLHGGSAKIREAVKDVALLLRTDASLPDPSVADPEVALVTPGELQDHLLRVQHVLDTDPHFRYGISLDPEPPEILGNEDLVAASQATQPDGRTVTVRIYQRFDEALRERPIPIKVTFAVGDATFDRESFEMWRKYGKPLTAPAEVEADLPGGLGDMSGELAQVTIHPVGQTYDARFRIRKPDGTFGITLSFSITVSVGSEGTGTWEHGTDDTGFLTMEIASDLETHTGAWHFTRHSIVGAEVMAALPSVEFLQDLHAPNVLQAAQKYGPFGDYGAIPSQREAMFPDALVDYLRALAILQTRTSTPILIPDLTTVSVDDVQTVTEAGALINGQTVIGREWGSARFKADATPTIGQAGLAEKQIDLANHYQIKILEPLTVNVGDQQLTLGAVERLLLSAKYEVDEDGGIVALPFLDDTTYRTFAPDSPVPDNDHRPVASRLLGTLSEAIDSVGSVGADDDGG